MNQSPSRYNSHISHSPFRMLNLTLALLLALSALLFGCSPTAEPTPPADTSLPANSSDPLPTDVDPVNPADIYAAIADAIEMPEMMDVPESLILDQYGIEASDYDASVFTMCVDSLRADEYVIIRCIDNAAADRVADKLERRLKSKADQAEGYSPEQFAIINKCAVTRDGLLISMLVSPDIETVTEIYQNFLP